MGYLAQLARGTWAPVTLSRRPAWMPRDDLLVSESAAEAPSPPFAGQAPIPQAERQEAARPNPPDQKPEEPEVPSRPVATRDSGIPRGPVALPRERNDDQDMEGLTAAPVPTPAPRHEEPAPPLAPAERPAERLVRARAVASPPDDRNPGADRPGSPIPSAARPARAIPAEAASVRPPAAPVPAPSTRRAAATREEPATLVSVLAEIAQRSVELDRGHSPALSAAPGESSPGPRPGPAWATGPAPRSAEEFRLNIGSIVVQVESPPPESKAPQRPQARPPRPARDTSKHWARSFLDR